MKNKNSKHVLLLLLLSQIKTKEARGNKDGK